MIRRLILFFALLGLGFLVLRLSLGSSAFSARRAPATSAPAGERDRPPAAGIDVQPRQDGAATLTLSIEGEFEVQPTREMPLPDGSKILLPTYRLHADDTRPRPESDNLMEMRGVTVELFRTLRGSGPLDEPRAEKASALAATMVLVEIERDERGRPTIHEDRDMDFHDVVCNTLPVAGQAPMTLRVARARLRTTTAAALLRTAEREPFVLELMGDQPATVTGRGLVATVPSGDAAGTTEVRVLSEPRLLTADGRTELSARGELLYRESPAPAGQSAAGTVLLRDAVTMRSVQGQDGGALLANGDELRAGLRRARKTRDARTGALWQWLALHGTPARIEAGEAVIESARVDALPGADGGVGLLVATGSPARLRLTPRAGEPSELTAERRIGLVPIADSLHEWIGPLGFPRGALGPRFAHMITFAGHSTLASDQPGGRLTLSASGGFVALRGAHDSTPMTLRGLGVVSATMPGDGASLEGDDGVLIHDLPGAAGRTTLLTLGIGGAPSPRFELRRGASMRVAGHGRCELRQTAHGDEQRAHVRVESPGQDAVVEVAQGTLRGVRTFSADIAAGALASLAAAGTRCLLEGKLRDGTTHGESATVHSDDGRTFRLRGAPAWVEHSAQGKLFGSVVDLIAMGESAGLRARGSARLLVRSAQQDGRSAGADLRGELAEVLPWRVPPAALRWHASFLPEAAATVCAASWRTPHVHLRDGVQFDLDDPRDPAAKHTGHGDELWLALIDGGSRGLLSGRPAQVHVAAKDQGAVGSAETIVFAQADQDLRITLTPAPERESSLRLSAAGDPAQGGNTKLGVREMTVYCRGVIRVEQARISFLGPVRVLGDEGRGTPTLTVTADGMVMHRDASGSVTEIVADGHVTLASARVRGSADTMTLDVRRAVAVLSSRRGVATVTLEGSPPLAASHLEVDYTTYEVSAWYGTLRSQEGR